MDNVQSANAFRDDRPLAVQVRAWLGMFAMCSPGGLVALGVALAQSHSAGFGTKVVGGLVVVGIATLFTWSLAAMAAQGANPRFKPSRPDLTEFAKGIVLAPLWVLASGVRFAVSLLIGAGIAGLLLVGLRAL